MLEFLFRPVSQDYFLPYFQWECISEGLEGKQDTDVNIILFPRSWYFFF